MHLAHWNASCCTLGRDVLISGIRRCRVWLRESPEGPSSARTAPGRPTSPCRRGAALDRAWSSPAGAAAAPEQPRRPRGRASGPPQLWLSGALQPSDKAALLPRHGRLGGGGQGLPAEQTHAVVRPLHAHAQLRDHRGWRATCHPRKGSLIHSRNHGAHPLPAPLHRTNSARAADSLTRHPFSGVTRTGWQRELSLPSRSWWTFPAAQRWNLGASSAGRLIPDRGPNTPHALWYDQKKEVSPFADTFHS